MLIAKWLGWFRDHQVTTVFVLEIVAVFVGISVSLFVDDWRQSRTDQKQVHQVLMQIHTNALQHRDEYRENVLRKTLAAEDALALAMRKDFLWEASENGTVFGLFLDEPFIPSRLVGLERLVSSDLLADSADLQAELDFYHDRLEAQIVNNETMLEIVTSNQIELLRSAGVIMPQGNPATPGDTSVLTGIEQRAQDLATAPFLDMDRQDLNAFNAAALRSAADDEEFQALLTTLATLHIDGASEALEMEILASEIIETIEAFAPGIKPHFDEIGIDGPATGQDFSDAGGPSLSVAMSRSPTDPDVWSLDTELVDGEFVFRADNGWEQYWGAPRTYRNFKRGGGYEFFGNHSDVFPRGTAESGGQNIPTGSGRYRITFNTRTLEYLLERVSEAE